MKGCKAIIGIDRLPERLELAKELGATGVINTLSKDVNIAEKLTELTNGEGASVTIDTTGSLDLIRQAVQWTTNRGQIILVGVPAPDAQLDVHLIQFMQVSTKSNYLDSSNVQRPERLSAVALRVMQLHLR